MNKQHGNSMKRQFVLCLSVFLLPLLAGAANLINENFQSWTSQQSYGDYTQAGAGGTWYASNCIISPTAAANGTGSSGFVQMNGAGTSALTLPSVNSVGTVTVNFRVSSTSGASLTLQKSVGGGAFSTLVIWNTGLSLTCQTFVVDVNDGSSDIRLRFVDDGTRANYLHDVIVTDYAGGGGDDPNLSAASTLDFGQVAPGAVTTQLLALANTGASNTLNITALRPISGDTNRFNVGALPSPVAAGRSTNIIVVYVPGNVTGVAHSAVFHLISNDPSTSTQAVTCSGQTAGDALTVSNVQYIAGGGASPYNGSRVYLHGIASYADPLGYGLSDAAGGIWSGVYVADPFHRPELGDLVYLEGLVQEQGNMTVLTNVTRYSLAGTGQTVPVTTIRGSDLSTEAYEGVLVKITNVTCRNTNIGGTKVYWQASDSAANFAVAARAPYRFIWQSNLPLTAIQGMVFQTSTTNFVSPRFDDDFIGRTVREYAVRGLVMTPDGPRTNWYVHVRDDDIIAVTSAAPPGVTATDTGGIIFPGLIDAHNHPSYNSFPTLMFNNFPFGHRDEWGGDAEYTDWKNKRTALRGNAQVNDANKDTITKYGECLELMAGCIAIQGQSNDEIEHSHPDVILYNIEEFPSRIWCDIFPWLSTATDRTNLSMKIAGGAVNATMIHLCEGPDATSLAQFATWRNWGMLNRTVAIIHGTALGVTEFAQMAAAGAKLLWAPMSNMKLYGATANVKAAKDAGVLIGLSPDWTPSGCYNLLEELGYAWHLNQTLYDNAFTPREMCDMVTINNAICAGLSNRYGKIASGFNAGLMVIQGDPTDPYMSLINARPGDVLLTIVDGTPRFGSPALMSALGVGGESISIRGVTKTINIAVTHPFLDYSQETFATIRANLQAGHATLTPLNELDSEELQFLDLALLQSDGDDVVPFHADNFISASPGAGTYDLGSNLTVAFRYQDFWDNATFLTDLVHSIYIVPCRYSNLVLQTVAENLRNDIAHQTVNFTVNFQDMHTNYQFCFVTRDQQGNARTTQLSSVTFKLAAHTGGDSDRDGMPNEWEIANFGSFTSAVASANADNDLLNNLEEYIALTVPTNANSCYSATIENFARDPAGPLRLLSPTPTSTQRVYTAWWTTNLIGPIAWQPAGVTVTGAANNVAVTLTVTNPNPRAFYRVGVRLP